MNNEKPKTLGQIFGPLTWDTVELPFQHPAKQKIDEIYYSLEVHDLEDYGKLSTRDQHVWNVFWFEAQVMNGGIDAYIRGDYGRFAPDCLAALHEIGATQTYNYLKGACDLFPEGVPQNQEARRKLLQQKIGDLRLDEKVPGDIELDLYQKLLDYYGHHSPT